MKKLIATLSLVASLSPLSASAMTAEQWDQRVVNGKPQNIVANFESGALYPKMRKNHTSFGNFAQTSYDANIHELRRFVVCVKDMVNCSSRKVDKQLQASVKN